GRSSSSTRSATTASAASRCARQRWLKRPRPWWTHEPSRAPEEAPAAVVRARGRDRGDGGDRHTRGGCDGRLRGRCPDELGAVPTRRKATPLMKIRALLKRMRLRPLQGEGERPIDNVDALKTAVDHSLITSDGG